MATFKAILRKASGAADSTAVLAALTTDGSDAGPDSAPAGDYECVYVTFDTAWEADTVPVLTASINETSPTVGATLSLTTNASASATYQWELDGTEISGATSDTVDTTTPGDGDYTCVVDDGAQSVETAAVTVSAAGVGTAPVAWDASLTLPAGETHPIDPFRSAAALVAASNFDRSSDVDGNDTIDLVAPTSASNGTASIVTGDGTYAAGVIEYTAPASGGDTITYTVEDTDALTDTGTITITTEADNGYNQTPAIWDGDDYIDNSAAIHTSDLAEATFVIRHKTNSDDGSQNFFTLLDGANAELFLIYQVGLNLRVDWSAAFASSLARNSGAMGFPLAGTAALGHWMTFVLTLEDLGTGNSEMRMSWHRPDTGWYVNDSLLKTFTTVSLPTNTAARYLMGRTTAGTNAVLGQQTRFDIYPALHRMTVQANREMIVTPGGQPVDPTTPTTGLDAILGSPIFSLRQRSDYVGATGATSPDGFA